MSTAGKRIRMLRHKKGWSQEFVAEKLNMSIPAFSKIETGVTDVNLSRLEQIASFFNLSLIELLTDDTTSPQVLLPKPLDNLNERLRDRENEVILLQKK